MGAVPWLAPGANFGARCAGFRQGWSGFSGCGILFAQGFEGAVDGPAQVPAVDELVGGFAGGVMAAWQHAGLKVDATGSECLYHFERISLGNVRS